MYFTGLQPFKEINSFKIKTFQCAVPNKKYTAQQASPSFDLLSPSSFFEATSNIKHSIFADTLTTLGNVPEENWNVTFNFAARKRYRKSKKALEWLSKDKLHVANTSFRQETLSPQIQLLEKKIVNHILLSPKFSLPLGYQIRGFKSERKQALQKEGVLFRIQSFFKVPQGKAETDTVKGVLQDAPQTVENKEKIKPALSEGYLTQQEKGKPSSLYRWVRLFAVVAIINGFFLYLLVHSNTTLTISMPNNTVEVNPEEIKVTFNDVKGAEEAKEELKDIVQFLKKPEKFTALGAKLPKGVLLVGPPGTGKTLLARAVAGEAGVPFFHTAGSEFDDILVGQGARRVRDLFKSAKEKAPCVVFIDEIDSVGSKRTNSALHPYANQTINQLLSEMDGFNQAEGVIVIGATNRKDELDTALLRPGRFDIEVTVPIPDQSGRKDILSLYLSRVKSNGAIDLDVLARGTTGFTGADLHNMVNQAALRAAIDGLPSVNMKYLENARDKVLMGPERKSRIPDEETNIITAYHESGHAVVAYFTKDSNPLHKVTIIPRGQSLGHTAYIPEKESYHVTKSQLLAMMDTMMGGRAAEELIFGPEKVTSGASSDLKQATAIATKMVKEWGMSEKAGLRTIHSNPDGFVFNDLSIQTSEKIDAEIQRLLQESYSRAKALLEMHKDEHKLMAEALLKYETLNAEEIKAIMKTKTPLPPLKKSFMPFSTKTKKS